LNEKLRNEIEEAHAEKVEREISRQKSVFERMEIAEIIKEILCSNDR